MGRFIKLLLDLVFPPREEERIVRALTQNDVIALAYPQERGTTASILPYKDRRVRALIWQLKYKGDKQAVILLTETLVQYLDFYMPGHFLVLPIPLSRTRLHERGYNQVALIGDALEKLRPRFVLTEGILIRRHHNERQTTLSRLARIRNMRDAFTITDPRALEGKDVLILDDVTTTGATLREAEAVVRACGPRSVRCVAFAH